MPYSSVVDNVAAGTNDFLFILFVNGGLSAGPMQSATYEQRNLTTFTFEQQSADTHLQNEMNEQSIVVSMSHAVNDSF